MCQSWWQLLPRWLPQVQGVVSVCWGGSRQEDLQLWVLGHLAEPGGRHGRDSPAPHYSCQCFTCPKVPYMSLLDEFISFEDPMGDFPNE